MLNKCYRFDSHSCSCSVWPGVIADFFFSLPYTFLSVKQEKSVVVFKIGLLFRRDLYIA